MTLTATRAPGSSCAPRNRDASSTVWAPELSHFGHGVVGTGDCDRNGHPPPLQVTATVAPAGMSVKTSRLTLASCALARNLQLSRGAGLREAGATKYGHDCCCSTPALLVPLRTTICGPRVEVSTSRASGSELGPETESDRTPETRALGSPKGNTGSLSHVIVGGLV